MTHPVAMPLSLIPMLYLLSDLGLDLLPMTVLVALVLRLASNFGGATCGTALIVH